jgi:hypothetical protein
MNKTQSKPQSDKPQGIPIWAAFLALLVFTLVGLAAVGGVFYYLNRENAKLRTDMAAQKAAQDQHELERQKGAEAVKLTMAANRQKDLLAQTQVATNALEQLLREVNSLTLDATALKTNEDGKRIALYPQLVDQTRAFYQKQMPDLPPTPDITTRLEGARRMEQQILSQAGTAYEPESELVVSAQKAVSVANQDLQKLAQARTFFASLIQESKVKYTTATLSASSPTLEVALQQQAEADATKTRQTLADNTTEAKDQALQTLAKAEAQRIIDEANREAAKIRAESEEKKAALDRDILIKKADQQTEEAKNKVAVATVEDEARKIELRKKAADPAIQAKLASFITPGYWQIRGSTLEKKPLSFTKLVNSGALASTPRGGSTMATIVSSSNDRVRPRWKINSGSYLHYPDAIERIKEAQELLTELGPVLVEMKLLEP